MGKSSPKTVTSTDTSNPQPYVGLAQQNFLGTMFPQLAPQMAMGSGVAGFTPDQQTAFGMIRGQAANPDQLTFNPATAAGMTAAQLDPNAYKPFMNPWQSEVVDRTTANMRTQHEADLNAIRAREAASHSFAGSGARSAFAAAKSTDDFNRSVGDMTASLMAQGYDKATALAMANTQMEQQARSTNAGYQQQAGMYNAQGQNATNAQNLELRQQAIRQLLGIGDKEQNLTQLGFDRPLTVAKTVGGLVPQQYGGTTTSTKPSTSPSTLQTILGLAGTVGGAYLGGPMGASAGGALGSGIGSLFGGGGSSNYQPLTSADYDIYKKYGAV